MAKLLLIDGSNLLFQMFFGMPARIFGADGRAIQGVLGFVGALLKIIRMVGPTHVLAVFDGEIENTRADLDKAYKANRPDLSTVPEEENPYSQLGDIYRALDYLQIKHFETTDCEADDVIASYALTLENTETVISSFDSDLFQLLSEHVSVLRYRGKNTVIYTPALFREKFGISPAQYADFKSLTGDTADNIKGAEKVGKKTAAQLICKFGTLEAVLQNAGQIEKSSVRRSITENAERLRLNYRLIKLDGTAKLPFALKDLRFEGSGFTTTEVLRGIRLK